MIASGYVDYESGRESCLGDGVVVEIVEEEALVLSEKEDRERERDGALDGQRAR